MDIDRVNQSKSCRSAIRTIECDDLRAPNKERKIDPRSWLNVNTLSVTSSTPASVENRIGISS